MKELNIMETTVLTSPNPLTLICSKKLANKKSSSKMDLEEEKYADSG